VSYEDEPRGQHASKSMGSRFMTVVSVGRPKLFDGNGEDASEMRYRADLSTSANGGLQYYGSCFDKRSNCLFPQQRKTACVIELESHLLEALWYYLSSALTFCFLGVDIHGAIGDLPEGAGKSASAA